MFRILDKFVRKSLTNKENKYLYILIQYILFRKDTECDNQSGSPPYR